MDGPFALNLGLFDQEAEQLSRRQPKAWHDIGASQRSILGEDDGFGEGGVDGDSPSTRIDEP